MSETIRYFAIVHGRTGYALDYYADEKRKYERSERKFIIGDFSTYEEAIAAVYRYLRSAFCDRGAAAPPQQPRKVLQ
jgi:hypothetical protein